MSNVNKITREHKSYEVNPDGGPMVYSSCRRPLMFEETKEAPEMLEYDPFWRSFELDKEEEAGDSISYGSSGSTLEF